jgi:hypothetical protein
MNYSEYEKIENYTVSINYMDNINHIDNNNHNMNVDNAEMEFSDIMNSNSDPIQNLNTYTPEYLTNRVLECGVIKYGKNIYLLDYEDKDKILNCKYKFTYTSADKYPSYTINFRKVYYLDFLYGFKELQNYKFNNNNPCDLRKSNVKIMHRFNDIINEKYNVLDYIQGHYLRTGQDAGIMKNPMWKIEQNQKIYLLMYCEKETICKLCPESYKKITDYENANKVKLSWFKNGNGYIMCSNGLYIHQVILDCYGNGKGTSDISVDHIDRDPLNNTLENLRTATRKEQEANSKGILDGTKRERKHNAIDLPDGISQDMMRKYVYYCHEYLDKDKTRPREFFRVEKHPKYKKVWSSSKSNKISLLEKLAQANKVVDDLENDIYPDEEKDLDAPKIPKYISFHMARGKPHLVFEKYLDGKRLNLKMVLPDNYDLPVEILRIAGKVKDKYDYDIVI